MSALERQCLVAQLLNRGDDICIVNGELVIHPKSILPVPKDWLAVHRLQLIQGILAITGTDGFVYRSYSTGNYLVKGSTRRGGLTLQFESLLTGESAHITYNVNLMRTRSTEHGKKGDPLPKGHFTVNKGHHLYKFWQSTGVAFPRRLSALHDYMGNLETLIFSSEIDATTSKIINKVKIIPLLSISVEQLRAELDIPQEVTDIRRTVGRQATDNCRTIDTDKDSLIAQSEQGLQPYRSARQEKYEIGKQEDTYTRNNIVPIHPHRKEPQEQTREEWLTDYGD